MPFFLLLSSFTKYANRKKHAAQGSVFLELRKKLEN